MEKIEINNCVYKLHPVYDLYASNEAGQVINIVRKCPMIGTKNHRGYYTCLVRKHGQSGQKAYQVHRFVWECHNGLITDGKVIDHINDNKTDNRLCNLQMITQKENCKKSAKTRDYSFVSKNHQKRKCIRATNQTNNKATYFFSMYAVQKTLRINVGIVKMACEGLNNCKSGISKLDGDRYTFEYIDEKDMPDIRPKISDEEKKEARNKYLINTSWICHACGNRDYSLAGKTNHLRTKKHSKILKP